MRTRIAIDKLLENTIPMPETGCWLWLGDTQKDYGRIRIDGKEERADVVAWESQYGRLSEDQRLYHKCKIRCCINPKHLSPVQEP